MPAILPIEGTFDVICMMGGYLHLKIPYLKLEMKVRRETDRHPFNKPPELTKPP
jgi:hypothetical protein